MTNPRITPAGISALAAFVHEVRPDWHTRGVAAALHKLADVVPPAALGIAAIRAACDPANDTPEAFVHLANRAWDSDGYLPCPTHPDYRARRTSGECGACYAERRAVPYELRDRGGRPIPDDDRRTIRQALTRQPQAEQHASPDDATTAQPRHDRSPTTEGDQL